MNNLKFEFSIDEINIVLAALGQRPFDSVAKLIQSIHRQAEPQLSMIQKPAEEKADDSIVLTD
jgi:hypothetical protein